MKQKITRVTTGSVATPPDATHYNLPRSKGRPGKKRAPFSIFSTKRQQKSRTVVVSNKTLETTRHQSRSRMCLLNADADRQARRAFRAQQVAIVSLAQTLEQCDCGSQPRPEIVGRRTYGLAERCYGGGNFHFRPNVPLSVCLWVCECVGVCRCVCVCVRVELCNVDYHGCISHA